MICPLLLLPWHTPLWQVPPVQTVPLLFSVQLALQQLPAVPLAPASSHCSFPSTTPSPSHVVLPQELLLHAIAFHRV
jgi:hypothetical protein